ncbi:MAG: NAD(P)H-dependent oxidoreductase [Methylococcaceae bacterium]|jgi:NAD(P)H dehydrogenase (quinone)
MKVFIVYAHHEPSSFNAAMRSAANKTLTDAGHQVVESDLYAMGFDPVSDRRNFTTVKDPAILIQQDEESYANLHDGYVAEIKAEQAKLAWCDCLILQFPIWWLGMPAILKGWVDRVFSVGHAYGGGRWFDQGRLAGKQAMCSITVGGLEPVYTEVGIYGAMETILYPIHRGILGFCGFTVRQPFIVYAPVRLTHEARVTVLKDYQERLLNLDKTPIIKNPKVEDYEGFILKSAIAERSPYPKKST